MVLDNVTLIGSNTEGVFSDILDKELPNGSRTCDAIHSLIKEASADMDDETMSRAEMIELAKKLAGRELTEEERTKFVKFDQSDE